MKKTLIAALAVLALACQEGPSCAEGRDFARCADSQAVCTNAEGDDARGWPYCNEAGHVVCDDPRFPYPACWPSE